VPTLAQSCENLAYLAGVLSGFADRSPLARANAVQLAVDVRRAGYDAPGPWDGLVGGGPESGAAGEAAGRASFEILAGGGGGGKGSMLSFPALMAVAGMGEEGLRDDGGWPGGLARFLSRRTTLASRSITL